MKKSILFLLFAMIIGISFNAPTGLAKDNLLQIAPVLENMPVLYTDLVSRGTIVLAQTDSVQTNGIQTETRDKKQETAMYKDDIAGEEDFDLDLFDEYEDQVENVQMVADPLYYFNYAMYSFNDFLYFYALKPIAQGYKFIAPTPLRNGVNNFFHNLLFPVRFVNNILQGKLLEASDEIGIFLANSTLGILGFSQFAQKNLNMETSNEDLGQTLGSLSIGNGFYLVLPILGPSTLRDGLGRVGDYFITPVNYVEPWELSLGINTYDKINRTSFRIGDYEALKDASLDPYVAIRNAYIQNRRSEIEK